MAAITLWPALTARLTPGTKDLQEESGMPVTDYASETDVARAHNLQVRRATFVEPMPATLSKWFLDELDFTLREVPYSSSESFVCHTLIYPLLREVWKPYFETLMLWGHQPLVYDADLCGTPDFIVARRSPLGAYVLDLPYLLVMEAKKDDYLRGWGQCLAAMLAAKKLNGLPGQTLYGITTNGRAWEFGQLTGDVFTQEAQPATLRDIDELAGAINFVLSRCRDQALNTGALSTAG
jgi:hypothetical protein